MKARLPKNHSPLPECKSITTQRYNQCWKCVAATLQQVGVECTGSYGAGLLRYLQRAEVEVLEVTAPDKTDRRKRGKDDTMDAENAAHAAFANIRTVTPKPVLQHCVVRVQSQHSINAS